MTPARTKKRLLTFFKNRRAIASTALVAAVTLSCGPVNAGDWSAETRLSEKADLNDNYNLAEQSPGYVLGSISEIYLDIIHKGYDHRFDFISDLNYRNYVGPGQPMVSDGLSPNFQIKFNQKGKTQSLDLAAAYSRSDVASTDPLDPANTSNNYVSNSYSANASWSETLDALNSVGISSAIRRKTFENAGGAAFPSISNDEQVFWKRRLTKRTDLALTSGFSILRQDNPAQNSSVIYKSDISLSSQLSRNLKVNFGTGLQLVNQFAKNSTDSSSLGWVGNFGLTYQFKRGIMTASASESLEPGELGDLQKRTSFGFTANYKINELSSLGLSAQYRLTAPPNSSNSKSTEILILNPAYSYQLTPQWATQLGYRWTSSDQQAFSNNVYLSFTKSWVVLP